MRKFLLVLSCAILSAGLLAQRPVVNLKRASVDPVVDGVIDEVWAEAADTLSIEVFDPEDVPPTLGESGETNWRALWTWDGIYVLVNVTDDDFYPHYEVDGAATWQHDKPELYFDVNWDLEDGLGPMAGDGHYQVAPGFTEGSNDGTLLSCGFNGTDGDLVDYAFMVEDPNYVAEYFIPFSSMTDLNGESVDITAEIGFDVTVIDRDDGDEEQRGANWSNDGSSWENMDNSGIIILEGADEAILIEEITLSDGLVDENNGTLQMEASISPDQASNKNLRWSVVNGTGKASINNDGVLRGIIDGEVIVKAEATDDSYVEAEATVIISNQIVTLREINVIQNGFFEDPDGSAPSQWGFYVDASAPAPAPQVVDGYVALQPKEADALWKYSLTQSNLTAEPNIDYIFAFLGWADATEDFQVSFEDIAENNWNRYGVSEDPRSGWGRSDWTFPIAEEPTWYIFDVNFDQIVENTVQMVNFPRGTSGITSYLDSVMLYSVADSARLTDYTAIEYIEVTAEGDVSEVALDLTLQMAAAITPDEADYKNLKWMVEPGTGAASIDANGLLSPEASGTVMVKAMAQDDSEVVGAMEVTIGYATGMDKARLTRLHLYPNPAGNVLHVLLPEINSRVEVFNASGALVDSFVGTSSQVTLDVSEYPAGMYVVRCGQAVGRFVK